MCLKRMWVLKESEEQFLELKNSVRKGNMQNSQSYVRKSGSTGWWVIYGIWTARCGSRGGNGHQIYSTSLRLIEVARLRVTSRIRKGTGVWLCVWLYIFDYSYRRIIHLWSFDFRLGHVIYAPFPLFRERFDIDRIWHSHPAYLWSGRVTFFWKWNVGKSELSLLNNLLSVMLGYPDFFYFC